MKGKAVYGAAFAVLLGAAAFAALDVWPWRRFEPPPPAVARARTWIASDTLREGESLSDVFGRHGIGASVVGSLAGLLDIDPRRLRAGLVFRFGHRDSTPALADVTVRTAPEEETRLVRSTDSTWVRERRPIHWSTSIVTVEGRVESSLYDALAAAAASDSLNGDLRIRLAWDVADVFAWEVDFTRDVQPNDRVVVAVEKLVSELGEVRLGRIVAGRLEVAGRALTAFRFRGADGRDQFFDQDGRSLRRAFLRAPVEFRRISSRFSRSRLHPILGIWRRHEGLDYSAAAGTPVLAAGDGTVRNAGWTGGYGRLIEIRHRNGIDTRYGHLSGFGRGIRPGVRVSQGQVIGFVGSSGLATAAHLHYEFRMNGAARDPAKADLGPGDPIPSGVMAEFLSERDRLEPLLHPFAGAGRTALPRAQ